MCEFYKNYDNDVESDEEQIDVSVYPKKNDNLYSPKKHNDNDRNNNTKKNVHFNQFITSSSEPNRNKKNTKNVTINLNNNYKPPKKPSKKSQKKIV